VLFSSFSLISLLVETRELLVKLLLVPSDTDKLFAADEVIVDADEMIFRAENADFFIGVAVVVATVEDRI
jgi:hypothetical protein